MVRQAREATSITRRRARASLAAAALVAVLGLHPSMAAADPLLADMEGDWIGRGTFVTSDTAAPELVYCRITNRLTEGDARLEQRGRCAVASNSSAVTGHLTANGGGRYSGALHSISSSGPANVSGTGSAGRLELTADFVDRRSRERGKAVISLVVTDGRYRLVSNPIGSNGAKHYPTTDIVFTKQ